MTFNLSTLAADLFHLSLSDDMVSNLETYAQQLVEWNEKFNLTAITDPEAIQVKHFLDSLSILSLPNLPTEVRVIDAGTGAGFPALVLAIARPDWRVDMFDATGKKVTFLQHIIDTLGLTHAKAFQGRAEDLGQDRRYREKYDVVVARAVARMATLSEYLLPFCKVGGLTVALKGSEIRAEMDEAAFAIEKLGGAVEAETLIHLPTLETPHTLVSLRKVRPTESIYPRRVGVPSKTPLMGEN